ncbi:hypothetical protein FHX37_4203 [Haloactinospora alba]|uniref:Uncharacterized protein n=1 Tax=Haloactinospora alba TaxID=405555 RepID=A0A543N6M9_9ACTN|nr:hypothetical protein FHX37_4203 [Haloactinospora alba]
MPPDYRTAAAIIPRGDTGDRTNILDRLTFALGRSPDVVREMPVSTARERGFIDPNRWPRTRGTVLVAATRG